MKKYRLVSFVFILSFILLAKSVSAYDSGCTSAGPYSTTTGQLCIATTVTSCNHGDLFSSLTGQSCTSSSVSQNNSSAVVQFEALNKSSFTLGVRSNSDVKALQQFLQDQGYYLGKVDGFYGRITARAVSDFKYDNNLSTAVQASTLAPVPTVSQNGGVVVSPSNSTITGGGVGSTTTVSNGSAGGGDFGENKGQNCGTIQLGARNGGQYFLGSNDTTSQNVENCMLNAFQSCAAANFGFSFLGIDTSSKTTYIIKRDSNNQCSVRKESNWYSANFGGQSGTTVDQCTTITQDSRGFLIKCNAGDLLISPNGSPEIPNNLF